MGNLGQVLKIQDELYTVVRTLKVALQKALTLEEVDYLKKIWHAEKVFRQGTTYFFVNEITVVEPIYEQDQGTSASDSPESTAGGQVVIEG
jgi:hypothetical protein